MIPDTFCPECRFSASSVDPVEGGQPEFRTTAGTMLDLLAIGPARRLVIKEHQEANALSRAGDPAENAVTAYATERGRLQLYSCLPFLR